MDNPKNSSQKDFPIGLDEESEEQYSLHSNLLQQFAAISSIDKAWIFNSNKGKSNSTFNFQFSIYDF
jgi:acylaminoacyl-peptidase